IASGGDVGQSIHWGGSSKLYFTGDWEVDNTFRAYRVDADGQNREQVPGTSLTNGNGEAGIGNLEVSPDGTRLAFTAEAPNAVIDDVFVLPLTGGVTAAQVSNVLSSAVSGETRGPSFFNRIVWSLDGAQLLVTAGWTPTADNTWAFSLVPTTGMGG